jgi:hypothetical protein
MKFGGFEINAAKWNFWMENLWDFFFFRSVKVTEESTKGWRKERAQSLFDE